MSGGGLISVRLPRSLLDAFRASADRQGISVHRAAQTLIEGTESLAADDFKALRDPPSEVEAPRVTLYIGLYLVQELNAAAGESNLSVSTIFRRLAFGLLIAKTIKFVQHEERWKLQFVQRKINEEPVSNGGTNRPPCA